MGKIKKTIVENVPEIIFILGLFFIIFASFTLNYLLGLYVTGGVLCGLGVFLAKYPVKNGKGGE